MTGFQNLHTHTTYCDGKLPPEAMIEEALKKGCDSIGFSDHSFVMFEPIFSMTPETSRAYVSEIDALKKKYEGTIEIFTGVEHDYFTTIALEGLDFYIGAVHYVQIGDEFITIDAGAKHQKMMADEYFGGDYYAMAEAYFSTLAGITAKRNVDIIGHFDLITKYNIGGRLFDEKNPGYVASALSAMDELLKSCRLFEVNTSIMYRFNKPEPYPSVLLLKELNERGGEVILSSDSHDAESLCYNFAEMHYLLKDCGFKYIKRLTKNGFVDVSL